MSAIPIGEEETWIKFAMKVIKDVMEEENCKKVQNKYREFPEKNSEAEKEMIYKDKWTLDLF